MQTRSYLLRAATLMVALALAGCAAPPKQLYQWGSYQGALYQYLKSNGSDLALQVAQLEAEAQKNAASGVASPPGLHGHLALLYAKVGDDANAVRSLETERRLFPESATYVDFLLKNSAKVVPSATPSTVRSTVPNTVPNTSPNASPKTAPRS